MNKVVKDLITEFQEKVKERESLDRYIWKLGRLKDLSDFGMPEIAVDNIIEGSSLGGYYEKFDTMIVEALHIRPNGIIPQNRNGNMGTDILVDFFYRPFKKDGTPFKKCLEGVITLRNEGEKFTLWFPKQEN